MEPKIEELEVEYVPGVKYRWRAIVGTRAIQRRTRWGLTLALWIWTRADKGQERKFRQAQALAERFRRTS